MAPEYRGDQFADAAWPPEVSIIIPTLNERENVEPVLARLQAALKGVPYEVVFVDDDSIDGTPELVRQIGRTSRHVRLLQRVGRRGLASACIEGMLASSAPYMAVMDADLQHDETILPLMLEKIRAGGLDLVIGSRNIEGGGMGEFTPDRVALSNLGRRVSRIVSKHDLSDPMSGYFMLTRAFLERVMRRTTGVGFKILLDLVASSPSTVRFSEVPYHFRTRQRGASKLDVNVGVEYLYLVADKLVGDWLPVRFVLFCLVGVGGLVLHMSVLWALYRSIGVGFGASLLAAIGVATIVNYALNNVLTYRDRRRRGWALLSGLFLYTVACSLGNLSNYALAAFLMERHVSWLVAGLCGLAIGSVWNFGATSVLTWRAKQLVATAVERHRKTRGTAAAV